MKRILFVLLGAMTVCGMQAQVLEKGEPAVVYYSPKTTLLLDFEYTIETREKGIYAEFAERVLGMTDVVKENTKTCTLQDVHIYTKTETDYSRPHKVTSEAGIPLLLSISPKGILRGYNLPHVNCHANDTPQKTNDPKETHAQTLPIKSAPLTEDVLAATNRQAQAKAIARQIFHLRETRMYLLSGEVEHAPADGNAMKQVLAELDKQEQALTELFTGKKTRHTEHKKITIDRLSKYTFKDNPTLKEYLFFSEENGFTNSDNVDADTITVVMHQQIASYKAPADPKKKSKKNEKISQISYNLPGSAEIRVLYKDRSIGERTIPVAQLGIDVPLENALFTGEKLPVIVFNEKTGNILSITK